jgi:hypothetical protein
MTCPSVCGVQFTRRLLLQGRANHLCAAGEVSVSIAPQVIDQRDQLGLAEDLQPVHQDCFGVLHLRFTMHLLTHLSISRMPRKCPQGRSRKFASDHNDIGVLGARYTGSQIEKGRLRFFRDARKAPVPQAFLA